MNLAWFGAVLVAAYEGTRMLVRGSVNRLSVALLSVSVLVVGIQFFSSRYLSSHLLGTAQSLRVPSIPDPLHPDLQDLPPEDREDRSRILARARFLDSGELHRHYGSSGTSVTFAPSQQDLKDREAFLRTEAQITNTASDVRASGERLLWLLTAFVAVGLCVGVAQRRKLGGRNGAVA